MNVEEPGRALAPGLTVPILRVLASRATPATAAQLWRVTRTGTEAGVRRALERLTAHGVCLSDQVGERTVYSLNYDHVLYSAISELLRTDEELVRRLRTSLAEWEPVPVSAALFGSAARRNGDAESDIDLLVVRPALRTESRRSEWARQIHQLRSQVYRWTGNRLQVLDRSRTALAQLVKKDEPLIAELREDAVTVAGADLIDFLEELAS